MLLLTVASSFCQMIGLSELPETVSTFTGSYFYSRTLESEEETENIQQWVLPLFATSLITEGLRIRVHQNISAAQMEGGPSLGGLGNTRIRGSFSLFENTLMTYLGLSLPITGADSEKETASLSNLLYSEILDFGVGRIAEGFNLDTGFVLARPFEKFALSFGAGYVLRGSYDRPSQTEKPASYNPGNALSITTGIHFRRIATSLNGRILYFHYGDDRIDNNDVLKSGDEFSVLASAEFRFKPLILMLSLSDTVKAESEARQRGVDVNNLFSNRLNSGISLTYPLLSEILILKVQAKVKGLFDDGNMSAKVASLDGDFQLIVKDNLTVDVLAGFMSGDMDTGKTDISGFSLGLVVNYGF
jgi:hypothetical protein